MMTSVGRKRFAAALGLTAAAAVAVSGCSSSGGSSSTKSSGTTAAFTCPVSTSGQWTPAIAAPTATPATTSAKGKVNIVGFSTPKLAYGAAETAFKATPAGAGVSFSESYGPSGSQSKAVAAGQPADYVALSLEPDVAKLVPKFIDASWDSNATQGIVSQSIVVIAVRPGNPKHICGWSDLIKSGIKIVTPDPATSGSAKWNIMAAYSHVLEDGGTAAQGQAYLKSFFKNVVAKPDSGADATTTFLAGTGDALISYENEAIGARQAGKKLDYVVPKESLLIQNPGAVTVKAGQSAKDFLAYIQSTAGQTVFAAKGFRPVTKGVTVGSVAGANDPSNPFPNPEKLETIANLGGWDKVNTEFFDPTNGIVIKIEGD
ncbi:extracellular solute-binding protein [Jatrophihabitans sp.]|uniref:extracellular solute-binding protein n=1 Tax=Jatrophihabitans sp. TaxID=1932789 RepID=UPI0030C71A6D|nr:sulfate transporter, periplasmic sulfate-binding protein [Jatrophihabitans sp.]